MTVTYGPVNVFAEEPATFSRGGLTKQYLHGVTLARAEVARQQQQRQHAQMIRTEDANAD